MVELKNSSLTVRIAERGAEIVSVKNAAGYEYIWQADPKFWAKHSPLLFPVCGRLLGFAYTFAGKRYEMGNHGFAQRKIFAAEQRSGTEAAFTLTEDEETLAEYPFRFVLTQRYLLEGEKLRVFTRVHNPADTPLYCNFGSHEAYAAGGEFSDWSVRFEHTEDLTLAEQKGGYLTGAAVPYAQGVRELPLRYEMFADDSMLFRGLKSRRIRLLHAGKPVTEVEFSPYEHLLCGQSRARRTSASSRGTAYPTMPTRTANCRTRRAFYASTEAGRSKWSTPSPFLRNKPDVTERGREAFSLPSLSVCSDTHRLFFVFLPFCRAAHMAGGTVGTAAVAPALALLFAHGMVHDRKDHDAGGGDADDDGDRRARGG